MEVGSVFFFTIKDQHPWVIVSGPAKNADAVLIVNLTSWRQDKEQTCVVERGEHDSVTKRSCVYYEGATITSLKALLAAKDGGVLKLQRNPLPAQVLQRVWKGAAETDNLATGAQELLRQQGLIP
jgi:hypothetical protein